MMSLRHSATEHWSFLGFWECHHLQSTAVGKPFLEFPVRTPFGIVFGGTRGAFAGVISGSVVEDSHPGWPPKLP